MDSIDDRNLLGIQGLPAPERVKRDVPGNERTRETVAAGRAAIRDLLHGRDRQRLLVVVGPCSIHDADAAFEYAERLAEVAERTREHLLVVMRTYFEKPRTTVGWKGLINDPHLDGTCNLGEGLHLAREILVRINALGLPCGSELLDPISPQFVADLLSWGSIGARTSESQTHRELASGVSMPVGFKNATDGNVGTARDAMVAAGHPHTFLGIDSAGATGAVATRGNPDRHIILRGGGSGPNHSAEDVRSAAALVAGQGIARPILVDCSHANSGKDPALQAGVCRQVLAQFKAGEDALLGVMLESNLEHGSQQWSPGATLRRGVSITDGCMGWDETASVLLEIAAAVRQGPRPRPRTPRKEHAAA